MPIPKYSVRKQTGSGDFNWRDTSGELHLISDEPITLSLEQLGLGVEGLQHPSLICEEITADATPELDNTPLQEAVKEPVTETRTSKRGKRK